MFSKELELSISQAYQQARESRHEYLTVEHMLLALLDNASALSILSACGADVAGLEKDIRKVLEDTVPLLAEDDSRDTQPTIGFQRVLQRALYHVQSAGKDEVLGANVLVAIFSEKDSYANYLLNRYDVSRLDVVNYISHGISRLGDGATSDAEDSVVESAEDAAEKKNSALERFTSNLNERARNDEIDPLIGRHGGGPGPAHRQR
jgi:ATP-dependent Clp protease ATP-binding subunit ClpA